jgi:hypothetical protein
MWIFIPVTRDTPRGTGPLVAMGFPVLKIRGAIYSFGIPNKGNPQTTGRVRPWGQVMCRAITATQATAMYRCPSGNGPRVRLRHRLLLEYVCTMGFPLWNWQGGCTIQLRSGGVSVGG